MIRRDVRTICKTVVTMSLVLASLARVPFVGGLLLHDHGDDGLHSHAVTVDDVRELDLHAVWHHHHDDERSETTDESDAPEYADTRVIFLNNTPTALIIRSSFATPVASAKPFTYAALTQLPLRSDPTDASRTPSTYRLRPDCALDALLQSSQAILL